MIRTRHPSSWTRQTVRSIWPSMRRKLASHGSNASAVAILQSDTKSPLLIHHKIALYQQRLLPDKRRYRPNGFQVSGYPTYRELGALTGKIDCRAARHEYWMSEDVRAFFREANFFSLRWTRKHSTRSRPQVSITHYGWSKAARQTRSGVDPPGNQYSQPS